MLDAQMLQRSDFGSFEYTIVHDSLLHKQPFQRENSYERTRLAIQDLASSINYVSHHHAAH
jgi:hypothetical protein